MRGAPAPRYDENGGLLFLFSSCAWVTSVAGLRWCRVGSTGGVLGLELRTFQICGVEV